MIFKTRAGNLTSADIGLEVLLPGSLNEDLVWEDTWAEITMITHTKKGVTKIRRYPDDQADHTLLSDDEVTMRWT